ncbi:hypothetical protein Patl1_02614 [Pistacia atlantica]|uniref:Uncharacterized protein n=1 Tax=Pistacia atlantica TaxID=434234 RepID=A0ACC1CBH7_9ROSI|nr:hypothetical protein Patl1_02614 [Pistacia atlantica]
MDNDSHQELKAALTLVRMKKQKLDNQTAVALNNLIKPNANSGDCYQPPTIPQVPCLRRLVQNSIFTEPFEKLLTITDLRPDQSRLSLNKTHVQQCLVSMLTEDENLTLGIPVTTYNINGKPYPMIFKLWCSKVYVLTSGWTEFQQENKLTAGEDFITIWMFRNVESGKLCFVITSRKSAQLPQPFKTRRLRIN